MNIQTLSFNVSFSVVKIFSLSWFRLAFLWKLLWAVLFSLFLFFFVLYLFQVGEVSRQSYVVLQLKSSINETSSSIEKLEFDFLAKNSSKSIESLARSIGFENAGRIHYIRLSGEGIAVSSHGK